MMNLLKVIGVASLGVVTLISTSSPSSIALASPHGNALHSNRDHSDMARRHMRREKTTFTKRGSKNGKTKVMKRADGTVCRIRGTNSTSTASSSLSASASSSSTATVSASSLYASASASSSAAAAAAASASSSSAAAAAAQYVAPTTSSSAAPAPSPTQAATVSVEVKVSAGGSSTSGMNAGSKLGIAWPNGDWAAAGSSDYVGNYVGSKASWYYTWSPFSVGSADALGLEFVPMLWGPHQVGDFVAQQANWPSSVKNVLFFNEPNEASQCNMSPEDSVSYWRQYMQPLKAKGYNLGMAATTSAPSGLAWVQKFISLCPDCTVDFVPLHWYDVDAGNFESYVSNFHNTLGLPIWVTEYACQNFNGGAQCSTGETWSLHQSISSWFEGQSWLQRFAPFGVMKSMQGVNQDNALMNPDGSITALGSWYISSA